MLLPHGWSNEYINSIITSTDCFPPSTRRCRVVTFFDRLWRCLPLIVDGARAATATISLSLRTNNLGNFKIMANSGLTQLVLVFLLPHLWYWNHPRLNRGGWGCMVGMMEILVFTYKWWNWFAENSHSLICRKIVMTIQDRFRTTVFVFVRSYHLKINNVI